MVKHMKDLEAQTSVDIQSDSPKSSESESQPGNYKFSKENHTLGFLAKMSFTSLSYHPGGCLVCQEKWTSSKN